MVLIPVGGWKFFSEKILTFIYWFIIFEINQRNTILKNLVRGGGRGYNPLNPTPGNVGFLSQFRVVEPSSKVAFSFTLQFHFFSKG